jgi:hypothetical protein
VNKHRKKRLFNIQLSEPRMTYGLRELGEELNVPIEGLQADGSCGLLYTDVVVVIVSGVHITSHAGFLAFYENLLGIQIQSQVGSLGVIVNSSYVISNGQTFLRI